MNHETYLKLAAEFVRPCHSTHCRHYDLADGMICEVEYARLKAGWERGQWPALDPMKLPLDERTPRQARDGTDI